MSTEFILITIDGGAASGKSSTARGLAEALELLHVDTGSHYRAVTYSCLQTAIAPEDETGLAEFLQEAPLGVRVVGRSARITINDLTLEETHLRSPEVNAAVAAFAAVPAVRQYLLEYQRSLAETARTAGFRGMVMEGRDIGSVIFPDAPYRFFLKADEATRAARREAEGQTDAIAQRDRTDSARKVAPLVCPPGAESIDTSTLSLEAVIAHILERVQG